MSHLAAAGALAGRAAARLTRAVGVELARIRHPSRIRHTALDAQQLAAGAAGLRGDGRGQFFFAPDRAGAICHLLERSVPGWRDRTLGDSDRICARSVRLLGCDDVPIGTPIAWHRDLLNHYDWDPGVFFRKVAVPYDRADIKVPWELSRCQHVPTLGIAYALTSEARYAAEVVAQIDDWIAANPPGYGVNWACAMEAGIRVVNWLWAWQLISNSPAVDDTFAERFVNSLHAHGCHIAANIEIYAGGISTNHTLADYTGLLYLGLRLPELPQADSWVRLGHEGVARCMREQVASDGTDFENSIPYHRLVLEMFLGSHVLAGRNGIPFADAYSDSLERMLEFILYYTRPDGRAPLIGDADDGRLQILSAYSTWDPQDHRYLLAVGAEVFGRRDFAAAASGAPGAVEEVAWLFDGRHVIDPVASTPRESRAFTDGGRYVLCSADAHAVVCADEVGTAGMGNHKHNDIFGYELSVDGVALVVDCGSFCYTGDRAWRDRFRSTYAHNTVVVDGVEQNEMTTTFGMRASARVNTLRWQSFEEQDLLEAEHSGYMRLPHPVLHRRRFVLAKHPFAWYVLDQLAGEGGHDLESLVHLAPEATITGDVITGDVLDRRRLREEFGGMAVDPDSAIVVRCGGVMVAVVPVGFETSQVVGSWFAPRYGQRTATAGLRFATRLQPGQRAGYAIVRV